MTLTNQPQQSLKDLDKKPILTLLHFNDVYDIQPKKQKGGICSFKAKLQSLRSIYGQNTLLLFSGDAFSPSILSRNKKGWQMVFALNSLGIDAACYGNHEFDYEQQHTIKLAEGCNFPWLLGNITHKDNGRVLGNGIPYIIHKTSNNLKVGIFGVAGPDWISIMGESYEGHYESEDPEEYCERISAKLRTEQKCDFIIALTHMRNGDDLDLALTPTDIDIIMGGHDHVIMNRAIQKIPVIKSGSNFHQIGVVEIYQKSAKQEDEKNNEEASNARSQYEKKFYFGKNYDFSCQIQEVPNAPAEKIDKELQDYVRTQMDEYKKQDKVLGYADCPLQARFRIIRTQESNYGNFFADLFRSYYDTDIAFLNSGCIRNDIILPPGPIKFSKLTNIIEDLVIVKLVPGSVVFKMLESAVKGLPHSFMGSFLLVSGLSFKYDLNKSPRVQEVDLNGKPLEMDRMYSVGMPAYMGNGADGYEFVKQYSKIVDEVRAISVTGLLLKFFEGLDTKVKQYDEDDDGKYHPNQSDLKRLKRIKILRSRFMETDGGENLVCINPSLDQRIVCLNGSN